MYHNLVFGQWSLKTCHDSHGHARKYMGQFSESAMKKFVYSIIGVIKINWFDQYFGKVCLLHYSSAFVCAIIGIVCLRDYVAPSASIFQTQIYLVKVYL